MFAYKEVISIARLYKNGNQRKEVDFMTHEEYLALGQEIERHNQLYYDDRPEITDMEYDALTRKLKAVEAEHPDWVTSASPSQHVGTGHLMGARTEHRFRLLSLNDLFSLDDVQAWYEGLGSPEVDVEEKIDGLTIALTYIDGKLVLGATRGDGRIGEIVTEQAKQVNGIPLEINTRFAAPHNLLIVRAEVCQPVEEFERLNKIQMSLGKEPFANPRNCAAGGLRAKDPKVTKERGLWAFAFQVIYSEGWDIMRSALTQEQDILFLGVLGFIPVTQYHCKNFEDIKEAINKIGEARNQLRYWQFRYWTDGAVIKTDDLNLQAKIGSTEKYPLHSVAYKYPAEKKRTTIRKINVQVGRTGVLTPVAEFDPIQLSGTTVTKATLHNQKFINDRMLNVGAEIEVLKSGEIIPKVVGVPVPAETPFQIKTCPCCGANAVLATDENGNTDTEVMVCPNITGCPAQKLRYFEFFCSREVMDIRGMGPSVIAASIDSGLLNDIWDIYYLKDHQTELAVLEGFGEKKVRAILTSIEESKDNDIDRFIKALGISGVGRHIGRALAEKYSDMDTIAALTYDDLVTVDGIGDISARAILDFWADPKARARYEALKEAGVNTKSAKFLQTPAGTIFNGMSFVITGTLPTMSREEAKALIETNGGKVSDSVSKKTTYLLAGDKAGSKLEKAKKLGTTIISESDLKSMLI